MIRTLFLLVFTLSYSLGVQAQDSLHWIKSIKDFQNKLNEEYKNPKTSPLSKEAISDFEGLEFYDFNYALVVTAKWEILAVPEYFRMETSSGKKTLYAKYGKVSFELDGKTYALFAYQNQSLKNIPKYKDYLFIPFLDESCGKESYEGGRYIELYIPKENTFTLDFNKAYNPYCCYSPNYSCPIPPEENYLAYYINAGVKKFK